MAERQLMAGLGSCSQALGPPPGYNVMKAEHAQMCPRWA
jgi:hypothetical protein